MSSPQAPVILLLILASPLSNDWIQIDDTSFRHLISSFFFIRCQSKFDWNDGGSGIFHFFILFREIKECLFQFTQFTFFSFFIFILTVIIIVSSFFVVALYFVSCKASSFISISSLVHLINFNSTWSWIVFGRHFESGLTDDAFLD